MLRARGPSIINMKRFHCSWVSAGFGVISFVMFLPFFFKQYDVAKLERQSVMSDTESEKLPPPDKFMLFTLMVHFFVILFNFVLVEA